MSENPADVTERGLERAAQRNLDRYERLKAKAALADEMRPYMDYVDLVGTSGVPGNGSEKAWGKRRREREAEDAALNDVIDRYDALEENHA